jgi:opacity protein-like surface antigen
MRSSSLAALVLMAALSTDVVRAQDSPKAQSWPRFHIGVGVGLESQYSRYVGPELSSDGIPESLRFSSAFYGPPDSEEMDWKLAAGWRPVRVVGAEIQYVDFGGFAQRRRRGGGQVATQFLSTNVRADATVLNALLFVPEPLPWFDVYGKVGVAKLTESVTGEGYNYGLPGCVPSCALTVDEERKDSRRYVGIGARFKVASHWAVRVEYEEIDGDTTDKTTMLSLGIAWER